MFAIDGERSTFVPLHRLYDLGKQRAIPTLHPMWNIARTRARLFGSKSGQEAEGAGDVGGAGNAQARVC